jgi:hypothetical protein
MREPLVRTRIITCLFATLWLAMVLATWTEVTYLSH